MSSVNKKEIEKFSKMAAEWWDPSGKFKPLHKFNPIRIKYVKENIIKNFNLKNKSKPLSGVNILDIGSESNPPPQPMSKILIPDKGLFLFFVLKWLIIFSLIYLIRIGLNLCKGLNLPWGSHHSSAIFENFSISFLFTLLMLDN